MREREQDKRAAPMQACRCQDALTRRHDMHVHMHALRRRGNSTLMIAFIIARLGQAHTSGRDSDEDRRRDIAARHACTPALDAIGA